MRITCDSHTIPPSDALENGESTLLQGNPERARSKKAHVKLHRFSSRANETGCPLHAFFSALDALQSARSQEGLVVAKLDVKLAVPMEMETNADEGSRSGTSG
jgi:hypothetical protein